MADITELQSRITAALDKIAAGLEAQGEAKAAGADTAEAVSLREALEAERNANAQLEERVLAIKEKQEKVVARLEDEVHKLREEVARAAQQHSAMRQVNGQLRENNAALRAANASGVGDAALINAGVEAELNALKLRRQADRDELDAVLSELKPLVEGAVSA